MDVGHVFCIHPTCLDLTLATSRPTVRSPTFRYAWAVTRASVKRLVKKKGLEIQFVMTSEQVKEGIFFHV